MQVNENQSLLVFNTFHIDASCRYFTEVRSVSEILELQKKTAYRDHERLILGGGSNLLLTKNYNGLVIKNNIQGKELIRQDENHYYVRIGAGENWHEFVLWCIENNFSGIENLSLIPGNVGASPMQNIGAYGVELKDVFYELEAFHLKEKSIVKFNTDECEFEYRESIFKKKYKDQFAILNVTFKLRKKPHFNIS